MSFNITENRELEAGFHNFQNINDEYFFYYDETNNLRKFWFKDKNKLNIPIKDLTKNFVLGGLAHYKSDTDFNVENLKQNLKLQPTIKEIKLEHIGQGNFISCLKSKKLEIFLDWLYSNSLYIHYSSINIMYWSIVDIIDSIIKKEFMDIHHELKTVLYELIRIDLESFLKFLYKYDYPNIKRERSMEFLNDISQLIEDTKISYIEKYPIMNFELIDIILNLIKQADKEDLTFIMDEKDNILIDNLFHFYLKPLGMFKNSQHIFDEEDKIEKIFDLYDFYDDKKKWEGFKFENSRNNILIQFSDITVGLIGKLFDYTNNLSFDEINDVKNNLNARQVKNFSTIAKLLLKADTHSLAFSHSVQGLIDMEKFSLLLNKFLK